MTSRKRARTRGAGAPPGPAQRRRPRRLMTMTANDDTPREGQDSIDFGDHAALLEKSDEEMALAVEEQKEDARQAADAVSAALLNEDEALTDEKVHALWKVGDALAALSAALVHRVPAEHQVEREERHVEKDQ